MTACYLDSAVHGRGNATWHRRSVGLVLAVAQLQNGKTGALGPYGANLLGRADAWLCSVLCLRERLVTSRLLETASPPNGRVKLHKQPVGRAPYRPNRPES